VQTFCQRSLAAKRYPFILVDALVIDVRQEGAVVSMAVLMAYGMNEQGYRELLSCYLADSESQIGWEQVFSDLKQRGLQGIDIVVSDNHTGLVIALKKHFQGASWPHLKLIFTAPNSQTARLLANTLLEIYQDKALAAMDCLEQGLGIAITRALPATLAYHSCSRAYERRN